MYLSVISVLEIRMGILSVQRRDLTQGNILQEWFIKKVIPAFSGRILNVDMDVAMRARNCMSPILVQIEMRLLLQLRLPTKCLL